MNFHMATQGVPRGSFWCFRTGLIADCVQFDNEVFCALPATRITEVTGGRVAEKNRSGRPVTIEREINSSVTVPVRCSPFCPIVSPPVLHAPSCPSQRSSISDPTIHSANAVCQARAVGPGRVGRHPAGGRLGRLLRRHLPLLHHPKMAY